MEWLWFDPDRDEPTRWWTIDPQTGQPDGRTDTDPADTYCLGESALDDVSLVADAIATKFATKGFTDEEVAALLSERAVPVAFRGEPVDAADLVESVDDLWVLAETCYQRALGRPPDHIERQWLQEFGLAALRARGGRSRSLDPENETLPPPAANGCGCAVTGCRPSHPGTALDTLRHGVGARGFLSPRAYPKCTLVRPTRRAPVLQEIV